MALERTSSQNMRLGGSVLVYGNIIDPDETHNELRKVTAEDIQAVAADFLHPKKATAAVIGPAPDAKALTRILGH